MDKAAFEYSHVVQPEEIDILNHVNNVVYVQWVQEAALKHWTELIKFQKFEAYVWVVIRHEIDYIRQAFLHDHLTIKTWVGFTQGSDSVRHVEILKDSKIIARAATTWKLLDAKTFKPMTIPPEMLAILQV